MDNEAQLQTLEKEIRATKDDLNELLVDMRSFIMEVQSPLRARARRVNIKQNSPAKEA